MSKFGTGARRLTWRHMVRAWLLVVMVALWLQPASPPLAHAATLTLDPASGPRGIRIAVSGTGFYANQQVRIFYDTDQADSSKLATTTNAGSTGSITASFVVTSAASGLRDVFACSWNSSTNNCSQQINGSDPEATAQFQNQGSTFVRLRPGQGDVGSTTTLFGGPFASPKACGQVEVLFDGTQVATVTPTDSDDDGELDIEVAFTVPDRPLGSYPVEALQTSTGCQVSDETTFDMLSLTVDPSAGPTGSTFVASGAGFESDVPECGAVAISFDGTLLTSVAPRSDGTFDVELTVPNRSPATYIVEANQGRTCGVGGDIRATDPFTVTPPPSLNLLPAEGPPGGTTRGLGEGFTSDLPLVLEFDGAVVASEAADSDVFVTSTTFEVGFTVPERPQGSYVVVACQPNCSTPERLARATFAVRLGPLLVLDPTEGPIETVVAAAGADFQDGVDAELRFGPDGPTVAEVDGTDVSGGAFEVEFTVPEGVPGGPHEIIACQGCGTPNEVRASAAFRVTPRIVLDPMIGPPGFVTGSVGDGFEADAEIVLRWVPGIGELLVRADENGAFEVQVLVFHKDLLGPRELHAVPVVPPAEGEPDVPLAVTEFVVSPGTQQPRDFSSRR